MAKAILEKVDDGVTEGVIRKQIPRYVSRHISKLGEKTIGLQKKVINDCLNSDGDGETPTKT